MLRCGLLGEKLGHSWSPAIHARLGDYEYRLYEKRPEELERFLADGEFDGLNVTIPYKKTVMSYCARLSELAQRIGSVNAIVRRADGTLFGDNTDAAGFAGMLDKSGISPAGKKVLVLGSGGSSVMVQAVLAGQNAGQVVVISRSGEDNYSNLSRHADAQIIVNTTPVGMYPRNGESPVDLTDFPRCEGVLDLVYNPSRTALLLQAARLGIPHAGGLYMLVEQARRAGELFTGKQIERSLTDRIERTLARAMENVVLVGMPGSGKGTVAALLAEKCGRQVFDSDILVEEKAGMTIPQIFERYGEEYFRDLESEALKELGSRSGIVLATGGGSVLRECNYDPLHQNGVIFWLQRDVDSLPRDGRPISQRSDLAELYEKRKARYERFADHIVDNNGSAEQTVRRIMELLEVEA